MPFQTHLFTIRTYILANPTLLFHFIEFTLQHAVYSTYLTQLIVVEENIVLVDWGMVGESNQQIPAHRFFTTCVQYCMCHKSRVAV